MAATAENRGLEGLRVLSLESRRSTEMARLIENHGGIALSAPSIREVSLEENSEALAFANQLLEGKFDAVIFLTGVGTRILFSAVEKKHSREAIVDSLARALVVARGPKPVAALREFGVRIDVTVPEPNTWRDILKSLDEDERTPQFSLSGKRVAVQEYGASNAEFLKSLVDRGAVVTPVRVYQWALPEDLGPLQRAAREIVAGRVDVMLVTSAMQVHHLMQVAASENLKENVCANLSKSVIASIGPVSSEALESYGLHADLVPQHPKMGQLIHEAARGMTELLRRKPAKVEPQ
jgi:uroporphyrinogen-III synthase